MCCTSCLWLVTTYCAVPEPEEAEERKAASLAAFLLSRAQSTSSMKQTRGGNASCIASTTARLASVCWPPLRLPYRRHLLSGLRPSIEGFGLRASGFRGQPAFEIIIPTTFSDEEKKPALRKREGPV